MPGTVSTLVMVAQDPDGKGHRDKELRGYAHAWSKQEYSCDTAGCVVVFRSYQEFQTKLKSYDKIDRLAILSHAAKDGLSFPAGPDTLTPKTLEEIHDDLGTNVPTVNSLEFLGCLIGRHVTGMWQIGTLLKSKVVIAYTYAHAFEPFTVKLEPGDTEADVKERIGNDRLRYLLPKTDLSSVVTDPKAQLWIEWYRVFLEDETETESVQSPFDKADFIEHNHSFFMRSRAQGLQILTEDEAGQLEQRWSKLMSPPFMRVEVLPGP